MLIITTFNIMTLDIPIIYIPTIDITTFNIKTFSIRKLSIKSLFVTLSINDTQHNIIILRVSSLIVMLNVIVLGVMGIFNIQFLSSDMPTLILAFLWFY